MNKNGHHARKDFSVEQLADMIGRYVDGESCAVIAKDFDITDRAVAYHLKRHGVEMRKHRTECHDEPGHKWCGRCRRMRPLSAFGREKKHSDGLNYYCKECVNAYANQVRMQSSYGISMQEFEEMLHEQGGGCAICGRIVDDRKDGKERRLCVDHDHDTGEIRGILCTRCNTGIGMFGNDPDVLRRAINYLSQED